MQMEILLVINIYKNNKAIHRLKCIASMLNNIVIKRYIYKLNIEQNIDINYIYN